MIDHSLRGDVSSQRSGRTSTSTSTAETCGDRVEVRARRCARGRPVDAVVAVRISVLGSVRCSGNGRTFGDLVGGASRARRSVGRVVSGPFPNASRPPRDDLRRRQRRSFSVRRSPRSRSSIRRRRRPPPPARFSSLVGLDDVGRVRRERPRAVRTTVSSGSSMGRPPVSLGGEFVLSDRSGFSSPFQEMLSFGPSARASASVDADSHIDPGRVGEDPKDAALRRLPSSS